MKNILSTTLIFVSFLGLSQPEAFKYQAVVRDASGELLVNATVSFQITLLEGSISGTAVYVEEHTVTTSQYGSVTLAIGRGTNATGVFENIDWSTNSHFIQVAWDLSGGSNYEVAGTSELLSVPYALHAGSCAKEEELMDRLEALEAIADLDQDGVTIADGDCDDSNPLVAPGLVEVCDDGLDNDCNGFTDDEDSSCNTGKSLVVTEIMYDPSYVNDSNGEWFEVKNISGVVLNLNGYTLEDASGNSHTITEDVLIGIDDYFVFAQKEDTAVNGRVFVDYAYGSTPSLNNAGDDIIIKNASGDIIETLTYDNTNYPDVSGSSLEFASDDITQISASSNQDPANWVASNCQISGSTDNGTPGAVYQDCQ